MLVFYIFLSPILLNWAVTLLEHFAAVLMLNKLLIPFLFPQCLRLNNSVYKPGTTEILKTHYDLIPITCLVLSHSSLYIRDYISHLALFSLFV